VSIFERRLDGAMKWVKIKFYQVKKTAPEAHASGAVVYVSANGCLHVHTTVNLDNLTADVT